MRYRTQTTSHGYVPSTSWTSVYTQVSDGSVIGGSSGTQGQKPLGSRTEVIEDQGELTHGVKPCTHTVVDYKVSQSVHKLQSWLYENGAKRCTITSPGYISLFDVGFGYGPPFLDMADISIVYTKTKDELLREAIDRFYDVNEADSLLNALEAHQLVGTLNDIASLFHTWTSRVPPRQLGKVRLGELRRLNSLFLGYSFGIAPLIADLRKISRAIPQLRGRLREVAKKQSAPKTVTARDSGALTLAVSSGHSSGYSTSENPNDGTFWHAKALPMVIPQRIVGVRGRRAHLYNTGLFNELDYIMSRFIATGPASLAWEKVPFSFVFDWFVDISGFVHTLDQSLVGNGKSIDRCWWSESYRVLLPMYKHKHSGVDFPIDGQQIALSDVKYYHREPLSPSISIGSSGRFGKKQAILSGSLFLQMAANLRKSKR